MRGRRRVLLACALALVLHAVVGERLARVKARPVPPSSRVELVLGPPARPPAPAPAPAPARAPARPPPRSPPPPVVAATPAPPPVQAPAPPQAPPPPQAPAPPQPPAAPRKPSTFLERVIAGTSLGPAPSLDTLDPSRKTVGVDESDTNRAKRFIEGVARVDAPPVDAGPVSVLSELVRTDDGGYAYETGGFIATIHVDGSVSFQNKDNKGGLGASGLPGRELLDPYAPGISPPKGVDGSERRRVMGQPVMDESTTLLSGSFDPTAALLRAQGQDPYFTEKSCFLDDTAALRADLREKHERVQLAGLRRSLERAWFDDAKPAEERRAALFEIWDECREEQVGLLARQLVESFVRQHLPKGSADAYSDAELTALNARRTSTMEFRPYG